MAVHPSACAAIITAAGESSRMGIPKGALSWGTGTLLDHQLRCLEAWSQRIVVTGAHKLQGPSEITWLDLHNPAWPTGRSSSIARGAAALSGEPQAILVVAIDQPLVPAVLERLLAEFSPGMHTLARPYEERKPGHPVLFSAALRTDLMEVSRYEDGLRGLIDDYGKWERKVTVDDQWVHADLNTMDAYDTAHHAWLNRVSESEE